ncbi:hypothetical protein PENSPDRAFT_650908 [Peniophora sp. CONT]|nr:hypothetical protein PENSPDRAFT_650908 [Peniophora sp. CONT]
MDDNAASGSGDKSSNGGKVVEYKKDGTVSRMRSHKGNVPQLPQTKQCPFCVAKFTRTTHLNRHLRNHTNERLYKCEACGSQFTRSDLLARHKKSCGDSSNGHTSRSRRRSCQACAALKVKCDLRQPCSKCKARSRECVYPVENPDDAQPGPSRSMGPPGIGHLDSSAGFAPSQLSLSGDMQNSAFPELSLIEESSSAFAPQLSESNLASFLSMQSDLGPRGGAAMSLPTINDAASTVNTLPSFHAFDSRAFTSFVPSDIAAPTNAAGLGSFSSNMFEPFFRDVFNRDGSTSQLQPQPDANISAPSGSAPPFVAPPTDMQMQEEPSLQGLFNGLDGLQDFNSGQPSQDSQDASQGFDQQLLNDMMNTTYPEPDPLMDPPRECPQRYATLHSEIENVLPGTIRATYTQDELNSVLRPPPPLLGDEAIPNPTPEELQRYLHIFLTAFLPQIPVIHLPTLRVDLKPPILLKTMQACGALFAKTRVADAFVQRTLESSRETLVIEFSRPSDNPKHQMHIIMTLILLQTIGLFHQNPQLRASSNIYHGMLVLMIRQNRILERSSMWRAPSFPIPDVDALDLAWRDWTIHEAIKRCCFLAYTHDQSHRIFFALPASFAPDEVNLRLPCEESLWEAPNAFAWSQALLAESPYGSISQRLLGVPMLHGFAAMDLEGGQFPEGVSDALTSIPAIPPFGHFILLHGLLGELFRRCTAADSPANKPKTAESLGYETEEEVSPQLFAMQLSLHKWLKLWLLNPDAPQAAAANGAMPAENKHATYSADPLPFYWLGQLLLLAFQEGLPPFAIEPPPGLDKPSPSRQSSTSSPNTTGSSPYSCFDSFTSSASSNTPPSIFDSPQLARAGESVLGKNDNLWLYAGPAYNGPLTGKRKQTDASSAQFSLIKNWLQHIRAFLRRSEGSPTVVWDELMRIRLSGWYADTSMKQTRRAQLGQSPELDENDAEAHGLLGFFEEKLKI